MNEPSRAPNPTPMSLLLGLIGAPIASSAAPHMHQSAGAALGLVSIWVTWRVMQRAEERSTDRAPQDVTP